MHTFLKKLILLLLTTITYCNAQNITRIDGSVIKTSVLEKKLKYFQKQANIHGLTVSVVTKDSILFQKAFGTKNIKTKEPLNVTHNFYGASLSKPVFAFIVLKLVNKGVIDLDKPLIDYLDKPLTEYVFKNSYEGYENLKNDKRYAKITARMCLSHTTGLPNWRYIGKFGINMKKKLEIEFDPGTYYSYSGEGIQLLQFVVEKITKRTLENLAQEYVFKPFNMDMTSFIWQERFENNYAVGHYKKKKIVVKNKRNQEYAAGSMETTPEDYAKFIQAMLKQRELSNASYTEMFSPQIEIISTQQFGSNKWKKTEANKDIQLSYGLGWGIYTTPYGKAVFKEGHINGWEHYTVFYPGNNIGIVIMTNSSNGEGVFKELLEVTLADKWMPWYWEGFFPFNL